MLLLVLKGFKNFKFLNIVLIKSVSNICQAFSILCVIMSSNLLNQIYVRKRFEIFVKQIFWYRLQNGREIANQ
jgi:hypothetical protein